MGILEKAAGIPALVVNAFHVKNVPGRKTDVGDSEWLAQLARFGLLRGSFIPPKDLRELRIVPRYRRKLTGMLAGEKNRLHKLLDDAGIKLGGVVADIDGVCASKMVEGLIAGGKPGELAALGRGKVRATTDILEAAMDGELSARHRLVLDMAYDHLRYLEGKLAALDRYLLAAMQPYAWAWRLLQTIPGIDAISATMILIEIGDDPHGLRIPGALGVLERPVSRQRPVRPASVRAVRPATAIPSFVIFCARPPTPQGEPRTLFRAKYESLVIRRGHKKTIIALAHKLVRTIFCVLVRRKPYRNSTVDYEAASVAKNAPRWIRALKKYGYWPQVRRSKRADRGDRKLIPPARRTSGFGARQ